MNIDAKWHTPLTLVPGESENRIYTTKSISSVPNRHGVYMFVRKHGDSVEPLYIGRSKNLRGRLKQHLDNSTKLMMRIKKAASGDRLFLFCELKGTGVKLLDKKIRILEMALIDHALAEGHPLINEQGTKRLVHEIRFTGNRVSEAAVPRKMLANAT